MDYREWNVECIDAMPEELGSLGYDRAVLRQGKDAPFFGRNIGSISKASQPSSTIPHTQGGRIKINTKIAAMRLKPLATRKMDSTECRRSKENSGGPMATPA